MASGSVRAPPPRGGQAVAHSNPIPGQLCCAPISIQKALYQLAKATADAHKIELSTPPPVWMQVNLEDRRPCVFVRRTAKGIEVYPLSTFHGSAPEGWNLLVQEIVVPIGAKSTIQSIFRDRRAFQSHPAWTHYGGKSTYILPQIVILPHRADLRRLPVVITGTDFEDLRRHCGEIKERMRTASKNEIERLLISFQANPYKGVSRAPAQSAQMQKDRQIHVPKYSLNPEAAVFVPRGRLSEIMSFPDLENTSNCGSTLAVSPSASVSGSHTPPIHRALQANMPLPIEKRDIHDNASRKPSRSDDDDKENVA